MSKLALLGGKKTRKVPFPQYPVVTEEMRNAVNKVLDRGEFSTFLAEKGKYFLGGKEIRKLEEEFADYHGVKYAVSFNSATSALHSAVVACGVEPGEQVITSPFTFTSSATCILMNNAFPVFADIDKGTYCISPSEIEKAITSGTKAVIAVHLFGQCAEMDSILKICRKYNLKLIEDVCQAPGARYSGRLAGTMGDCGIFSLQESKHIPAGEGGMLITNDGQIAHTSRLIRNHGEVAIETGPRTYKTEILGYNYRMIEFEAAMGRVGLKDLNEQNAGRRELAYYLSRKLKGISGLRLPFTAETNIHTFYVYAFEMIEEEFGISRELFAQALNAEGVPVYCGYSKPLYLSPLYQERRHWAYRFFNPKINYEKGICPVAEHAYEKTLLQMEAVRPPATVKDMDDIAEAIIKIAENKNELMID